MRLSSYHQVIRPSLISCEQPSQWGVLGTRGIAIMCPCLMSFLVQYARDAIPTKPAPYPLPASPGENFPRNVSGSRRLRLIFMTPMLSCMLDAMLYCRHHNPFACIVAILWS